MKPILRDTALLLGGIVLLAGVAACGQPGTAGHTAGATAPRSAAPNPNAPETNPPGDIPDNQVYVPYSPPDHRFIVSVPEGWSRSGAGTTTVFTDKLNSVRIDTASRAQAPTEAGVSAKELPALRAATPGYVPGKVSTVRRTTGPAILITYQANSAPDPVTGKSVVDAVERYEFWRGGQQVTLTLSGPRGADNVDPWRTITDSLRWQR